MAVPKTPPPARRTWFEVVRTDAGFHARLVGTNGETVMASEVHPDRRDADAVLALCRGALPRTELIDERAWPKGSDDPAPVELTDKGKAIADAGEGGTAEVPC